MAERGRPRADRAPDRTNAPDGRPARVPMSSGNALHAPNREGYQRYWAIEGPNHVGEIARMEAAWWQPVLDDDGNKITIPAGGGNTHVLMEIEQQYYDEDIARQQQRNIDATQKNVQSLGEDEYVPMGRKNVVEREII